MTRLRVFTAKYKRKLTEEAMKETAAEMSGRVVARNPVLTGRSRKGWNASLNEPNFQEGAGETIASVINKMQPGDDYYFVNGVHYIIPLEYGHSRQAPAGMVRITIAEFKNVVNKSVRLF